MIISNVISEIVLILRCNDCREKQKIKELKLA